MLGDNVNGYLKYGKNNIIAKVTPYETPEPDSLRAVYVPNGKLYYFDKATGVSKCAATKA
jgi:hypothetical protein